MGPKILTILFLIHLDLCFCDYYWRDYQPSITKGIPADAISGGRDVNGEEVYIAQVNLWPHAGVHTGTISPGKDVWIAYGGPKKATDSSLLQILCSENSDQFKWIPATANTLHLVGLNTHIVRGGLDINHVTYIGRVKHQGSVIIGRVYTHDINNSDMLFTYNNREYRAKSYEILTYADDE